MILRDAQGEIDIPFTQDFEYKGALFSVVCPAAYPIAGERAIWCRLRCGSILENGIQHTAEPGGKMPVVPFAVSAVIKYVRLYRQAEAEQLKADIGAALTKEADEKRRQRSSTLFD